MSTRRTRTPPESPSLSDLENANDPVTTPGIMPPPGVQARVRTQIDYNRVIDPDDVQPAGGGYSDDLRGLAAEEFDDGALPPPVPLDPFSEFIETYNRFIGYSLKIVRLPDPATRRTPGHTYNRPCFELEILSDTPFDPNNLTGMLQVVNGNSGGVFRIWLTDENGQRIPGAQLDRLVIADPPKQYNQQSQRRAHADDYDDEDRERYYRRREREPVAAPALPVKSEMELHIEQMQRDLFQKVMMRALDPPAAPAIDPMSLVPEQDRLALSLLKQGDLLPTLVERISSLTQAPDRMESATWKDKFADAAVNLVTHNPQIVTTVTDIISRATIALATAFAPRGNQQTIAAEPIPIQHPPAQRAAQALPPRPPRPLQGVNGLSETPQLEDDDNLEEDEIEMMEDVTKLLLSDKPLSFSDSVIVDLREAYPVMFDKAMQGIAAMPSMMVIQYLCSKSDFCADMFNSPRHGGYLKQRLEELKTLIKAELLPPQVAAAIRQTEVQQEAQQNAAPDEAESEAAHEQG